MGILRRLKSGPCCWTVEDYAFRTALGEFVLFGFVVGIFAWYATVSKPDFRAVSIAISVIFVIPCVFSFVLLVAVLKESAKLLWIWIVYGFVEIAAVLVFFIAIGIMCFILALPIVDGIIMIAVGFLFAGSRYYIILIVYSVRCNIEDKKAQNAASQS